mgnify:CR=1
MLLQIQFGSSLTRFRIGNGRIPLSTTGWRLGRLGAQVASPQTRDVPETQTKEHRYPDSNTRLLLKIRFV